MEEIGCKFNARLYRWKLRKGFKFQVSLTMVKIAFQSEAESFRSLDIGSPIILCNLVIEHSEPLRLS
jgi:hypothetical protein